MSGEWGGGGWRTCRGEPTLTISKRLVDYYYAEGKVG